MGKDQLNDFQKSVFYKCQTEPPFRNEYWNNKKKGIYVDPVSGKILFSSNLKFDSGSGWPSFYKPVSNAEVEYSEDKSMGMSRIEIKSKSSGGHLGHVFEDGPHPTGLRYCVNSASLKFIPVEEMEKKGYEDYLYLFPEEKLDPQNETIILAGGCFWGMQAYFEQIRGIKRTIVGYAGGSLKNPDYETVCRGITGHAESAFLEFTPSEIALDKLLIHFMMIHDPTLLNRQGNDIGSQYRSAIFYTDNKQLSVIKEMIDFFSRGIERVHNMNMAETLEWRGMAIDAESIVNWTGNKIITEIKKIEEFYPAEDYHQKYLEKNPGGYCHINLTPRKV